MLCLYLPIHKFKNNIKVFGFVKWSSATILNCLNFHSNLWVSPVSWDKQENGYLAPGRYFMRSKAIAFTIRGRIWQLFCLFSYPFLLFKSSPHSKAKSFFYVNSTMNHKPLWHLSSVGFCIVNTRQDMCKSISLGSDWCYFQEWRIHLWATLCQQCALDFTRQRYPYVILLNAFWGMFVTCRVQGRALLAGCKVLVPEFTELLFLDFSF